MDGQAGHDRYTSFLLKNIPLMRLWGIRIELHSVLLIVVAYWALLALASASPLLNLAWAGMFFAVLMGSVLLHELGHCYGAHRVGGGAERVVLWPLGGIAMTRGAERSPFNEFLVTLLGPAVSLALALISTGVCLLLPDGGRRQTGFGLAFAQFWIFMRDLNWMLFLFNLLVPLFPMDSARLIRSFLSMKYDPQKVTYNLCLAGFFVSGAMTTVYFVGFFNFSPGYDFYTIFFLMIGLFGLFSCILQLKRLEYEYVYENHPCEDLPWRALPKELGAALGFIRAKPRPESVPEPLPVVPPRPVEAGEMTEREALLRDLEAAVEQEDFLRAAEIRDRLKKLPAESKGA